MNEQADTLWQAPVGNDRLQDFATLAYDSSTPWM